MNFIERTVETKRMAITAVGIHGIGANETRGWPQNCSLTIHSKHKPESTTKF